MKKTWRTIAVSCLTILSVFTLSGCGFKTPPVKYSLKLEVWGVFDDTDVYQSVFDEYRKIDPYVQFEYRKMDVTTYKQDLLDALASGNGPDIFMIHSSWVPAFSDKVVAAPQGVYADERTFRESFVDVVPSDFMNEQNGEIYGAPVSVDSLALYYNKDMFTAAGILYPPKTWEEFSQTTATLTKVDQFGTIELAGAAMGTAYNVNRSTDILSALLLQSGVPSRRESQSDEINFARGTEAFAFYTNFASTQSQYYSWNASSAMHNSIDAFGESKVAMMVNYSWQYDALRRKNAKLNIGIAPLPQFSQNGVRANYANYWGYVVAKNKDLKRSEMTGVSGVDPNGVRVKEAWQFLKFFTLPHEGNAMTLVNAVSGASKSVTLASDPAKTFLDRTRKPAARRDLVEATRRDLFYGPFAEGNIIAKSWRQSDPDAVEGVLARMIHSVNTGADTVGGAMSVAQNRLRGLIY